jgi:hypothetical protein
MLASITQTTWLGFRSRRAVRMLRQEEAVWNPD